MQEKIDGLYLGNRFRWFSGISVIWIMFVGAIWFFFVGNFLFGVYLSVGVLGLLYALLSKRFPRERLYSSAEILGALLLLLLLPLLVGIYLLPISFHPLAIAFFAVLLILEGLALYEIWRAWHKSRDVPSN